MTSVKEFRITEAATPSTLGRGSFVFTDAYSVFDWGVMPDALPGKGQSLCTMGAFNFELLEELGLETHYRGVVVDGDIVTLDAVDEPPCEMAIHLTQVPPLPHDGRSYDYDAFHREAGLNYLIPLEIIFRNEVPVGSSLRRRTTPADHELDYDEWPDEVVSLEEPIVEYSTKFEKSDRIVSTEEADRIAGPDVSLDDLEAIARTVNELVTDRAERAGLIHQDGKIECLVFEGDVMLADVVGTLDENRFGLDGTQVSKEVIRQYLKRTQPHWVEAIESAKAQAREDDIADWKSLCSIEPTPLSSRAVELASQMYRAATNAYTQTAWFDTPPLDEVLVTFDSLSDN